MLFEYFSCGKNLDRVALLVTYHPHANFTTNQIHQFPLLYTAITTEPIFKSSFF